MKTEYLRHLNKVFLHSALSPPTLFSSRMSVIVAVLHRENVEVPTNDFPARVPAFPGRNIPARIFLATTSASCIVLWTLEISTLFLRFSLHHACGCPDLPGGRYKTADSPPCCMSVETASQQLRRARKDHSASAPAALSRSSSHAQSCRIAFAVTSLRWARPS